MTGFMCFQPLRFSQCLHPGCATAIAYRGFGESRAMRKFQCHQNLFCVIGLPPEGTSISAGLGMSSGEEFFIRIISGLKPDGFWAAWFLRPKGRSYLGRLVSPL